MLLGAVALAGAGIATLTVFLYNKRVKGGAAAGGPTTTEGGITAEEAEMAGVEINTPDEQDGAYGRIN